VDVEGGGTPAGDDARLDEVILLRSATRRMRREEAPKHLLDDALAAATGRPALSHYVNVHDVTGVDPGAYAVRPHGLELVRPGDHRAESRRLCLDQRLGGDAAFTIFHTTELGELLRTHGARGYRVANLEAGLASGRVALAAFALGYGATALTFLDDDVAVFLGRPVTCLLVTAVGIPAAPVRPGALPGEFAAF
jgi:nitroreductase